MYSVSDKYKKILNEKLSLKSKSKFVVDNVEYISIIKTTPKLSHKNSSMIGGFPTKTCTFEIYDLNNNLNFQNKEITVYKGIEVDGNIEYVPQGVFIPRAEQITTNISQKTVKFENMQDKSQLFDVKYVSELNWLSTHTGLEIVQEICANLGIELETTTFNWYNYNFKQPNFKKNITCREVISRLAEIGGSIAFINRNGKLVIKSQYQTNEMITNSRYVKLSKEKKFGEINVVVLGKSDANDDIYYPDSLPTNKVEWKILDNPFVELYRKDMISTVAQYIIGKSITPFTLNDFVDGFCFDMNDVIKVVDRYGNVFDGVMLNYETNSRIRSNVGSDVQQSNKINYRLAGSSKQDIDELKFDVDNINNEIKLYAGTQISTSNEVNQVGIATLENCMATSLYKLSLKGDLIRQYNVINADNTSYPVYFDIYLVVESGENKDRYKLPLDHLSHLNDVYDEFLIEDGNIKFIQRVGTKDNKKYILSNPVETDLGTIDIKLYKGTNKIYLESFDTLLVNAKYLIENPYTKTFADKYNLISEINVCPENIKILTSKLDIDAIAKFTNSKLADSGSTIINGDNVTTGKLKSSNYKEDTTGMCIDLDVGTINSKNFKLDASGNVNVAGYIETERGLLTNLQFKSGYLTALGQNETSYGGLSIEKSRVELEVSVPENFEIVSAVLTLDVFKTQNIFMGDSEVTNYGKVQNIRLYKENNSTSYNNTYMGTFYLAGSGSEITGAFGANGFTTTTTEKATVDSIDIKNSLNSSGITKLYLETADTLLEYNHQNVVYASQQTQIASVVLNVLGYTKIGE